MVDVEIENIEQRYDDETGEVEAYIVEYSISQYDNTYRTEPIPADEFEKELAKERVAEEAAPLTAAPTIDVKFPSETTSEGTDSDSRRSLLLGAATLVGIGGLGGFGYLSGFFDTGDQSTQSMGTPYPNTTASPSSTPTERDPTERPTDTPSPTPESSKYETVEEFSATFEDGNIERWQPIEMPEHSNDVIGNDWAVVSNPTISGGYTLRLNSNGDHDDNTLATNKRVVDMSRDLNLEFSWMTPDTNNRGPGLFLVSKDGTNFEDEERGSVRPENGLVISTGTGEITNGSKGGHFCGDEWNHPAFETGTVYTLRAEKMGDTATLYLNGEQQLEATVRTTGQFRLAISASGTWGTGATNYFDDIELQHQ